MTKDQKSRTLFVKCACYGHAIEFEHDVEHNEFNVAIWSYGNTQRPLPMKERFRWAWKLFTTGTLWADEVVLTKESKDEIVAFLTNNPNEKPKTILHG